MARDPDYGAFVDKFVLKLTSSAHDQPLQGLTFAVKDIFDMEGYVTGFGHPDWARTHSAATSTAPAVLAVLRGGATCVGTDTGGSVRVPASYCRILGFRPSYDAVPSAGVVPLAQSFDTVGWFARDPVILSRVGHILLQSPVMDPIKPSQVIIAEDCFQLSNIPNDRLGQVLVKSVEKIYGGHILKHTVLGDYVKEKVPSLKHFMSNEIKELEHNIPSLAALSNAMRSLDRYEFKDNHGEWITAVKPELGPAISERVWEAVRTTGENVDACHSVKTELHAALATLLQDFGILAIPTVSGLPPKLQTDPTTLKIFRAKAFGLLSIAGVSGFCQVSIPLGMYDNLPVSVSLLAKQGSDAFLLTVVESLYGTLKEQVEITEK